MHHPILETGTVAIYARFSSDRQRETSIEDQVRRCREYIAQAGGDPDKAQIFTDYAVSGSGLDRPGFEKLMQALEERRIQAIVTEDLSRITRDFADAAAIFKQLQFARVPLIGVADGIDTSTKDAQLSFTMKSLVNDMYIKDLSDKTLRGLEGRHLAGYATGGVPYGFRTVADQDSYGHERGRRIEIHEEHAEIVRGIFTSYLQGSSLGKIARKLNEDGIPSPREASKSKHKRKGWGSSTIRAMLYNDKYTGTWKFKQREWVKIPGTNRRIPRDRDISDVMVQERPELRIIDTDLWNGVQERLAAIRLKYTRKGNKERVVAGNKSSYLLTGLLVCGECKAPMTIHGGSEYKYYRCSDYRTKGRCQNGISIREEVVRTRILGAIRRQLRSKNGIRYVRARVAEQLGDLTRRMEKELRERKARLGRVEEKIGRLISYIAQGEQSDYVTRTLRQLEAEAKADKHEIDRLAESLRAPIRLPSIDDITALVFEIDNRLQQDPEAGRYVLKQWFADKEIRIIPRENGEVVAEGDLLPLVVLEAARRNALRKKEGPRKKPSRISDLADPAWSNVGSGGRI